MNKETVHEPLVYKRADDRPVEFMIVYDFDFDSTLREFLECPHHFHSAGGIQEGFLMIKEKLLIFRIDAVDGDPSGLDATAHSAHLDDAAPGHLREKSVVSVVAEIFRPASQVRRDREYIDQRGVDDDGVTFNHTVCSQTMT